MNGWPRRASKLARGFGIEIIAVIGFVVFTFAVAIIALVI